MPIKEDLAQWVSNGLRRALSKENIKKGFEVTSIYPLNENAMNSKMGPSEVYDRSSKNQQRHDDNNPTTGQG